MGTRSKRLWREKNPELYAAYERKRAQARRRGSWLTLDQRIGTDAGTLEQNVCKSSASYFRYEISAKRMLQKMNHARWGSDWRSIVVLPVKEQQLFAAYSGQLA